MENLVFCITPEKIGYVREWPWSLDAENQSFHIYRQFPIGIVAMETSAYMAAILKAKMASPKFASMLYILYCFSQCTKIESVLFSICFTILLYSLLKVVFNSPCKGHDAISYTLQPNQCLPKLIFKPPGGSDSTRLYTYIAFIYVSLCFIYL